MNAKPPFKNSARRFSLDEIPGYTTALARERRAREEVFWDLERAICGFPVLPLTLERFQMLRRRGNAFIAGKFPTVEDINQFLFVMSPEFCRSSSWFKFKLRRFLSRCHCTFHPPPPPFFRTAVRVALYERHLAARLQNQAIAIKEISDFLAEAFQDAPEGEGEGDGPSFYAGWVGITGELARAGISVTETRQMPIGEIFQRLKEIYRHEALQNGIKPALANPSDKVLAAWQKTLVAKN